GTAVLPAVGIAAGINDGRANPVTPDLLEDVGAGFRRNPNKGGVHTTRKGRDRRIAAETVDLLVTRIDGIERAGIAAVAQVSQHTASHRVIALRNPDNGDRARPEQLVQIELCHVRTRSVCCGTAKASGRRLELRNSRPRTVARAQTGECSLRTC